MYPGIPPEIVQNGLQLAVYFATVLAVLLGFLTTARA